MNLIDIEAETRLDAWDHAQDPKSRKNSSKQPGPVKPIKIVAGNKCDLQESRQIPAREGLEWARKRGCGFMETSARNTVNIEETFALIVRRVVEARRIANGAAPLDGNGTASGNGEKSGRSMLSLGKKMNTDALGTTRAITAPLTPLTGGPEKGLEAQSRREVSRPSKLTSSFRKLACWR